MIDKLKIGAITYAVEEIPRLTAPGSDGQEMFCDGHIKFADCCIQVDANDAEQLKPHIVTHEAVHAILHQAGFGDHPESMVVALGYGLIALMRDNPEFVAWVMGGATDDA